MAPNRSHLAILFSLTAGLCPLQAQIPGHIPGLPSGMSGLPDLSSIGVGNAAGLLSYCAKNKLLGGNDASSVLGSLTAKPGATASKDYSAGQTGKVVTGSGSPLSLDSMPKSMKTKVCDMVLKQSKSLI